MSTGNGDMGTGSRRSTNGKNGAFFMARGDMVHCGGKGNLTLIYLVGTEGNRERIRSPVMHQVGIVVRGKMLEKTLCKKKQA